MPTPDLTGSPVSPAETGPVAAGAFLPDVAAIERLANAFFKGLTGGAPRRLPAVPASPPAPWTAPAPTSPSVAAAAVPIQPPMGAVEPPLSGVPSSVPVALVRRRLGRLGFALRRRRSRARSRPAASQTAVAAPRVDPIQSADGRRCPVETSPEAYAATPGVASAPYAAALSPFSAPLDLSAALGALAAATGFSAAPASSRRRAMAHRAFRPPGSATLPTFQPSRRRLRRWSRPVCRRHRQASPEPYAPASPPRAFPDAGVMKRRYATSSADVAVRDERQSRRRAARPDRARRPRRPRTPTSCARPTPRPRRRPPLRPAHRRSPSRRSSPRRVPASGPTTPRRSATTFRSCRRRCTASA